MGTLKLKKKCNNQIENLLGLFNRSMEMTKERLGCLENNRFSNLNRERERKRQQQKRKEDWAYSSVLA